jgi:DNA-binding response OmpR family regulator
MRELLKIFLEMEQYETTLIDKFELSTLLDQVRANKPDFILMDVHLNGANGLELLSAVRDHADLNHVQIMMTSGEDCQDECMDAGANGFLLKPYNPMDLLEWLHKKE